MQSRSSLAVFMFQIHISVWIHMLTLETGNFNGTAMIQGKYWLLSAEVVSIVHCVSGGIRLKRKSPVSDWQGLDAGIRSVI